METPKMDEDSTQPSLDAEDFVQTLKQISSAERKKSTRLTRIDLQSMPPKDYINATVVPILVHGITAMTRDRPDNPIEYLCAYLMKNKDKYYCIKD